MLRLLSIFISLSFILLLAIPSSALCVSAESAVLIEADSCEIVYSKASDVRMPMASTTKIMTAIVALENADVKDVVEITEDMVGAEGSSVYLKVGERLTLEELLYALMLASANDAAEAIAIHVSGSLDAFAALMNEKAKELKLENTHFTNPHGLDDELHYTTAKELALLTVYALENDSFCDLASSKRYTIPATELNSERYLTNHNKLLSLYEGAIGVKTGYTKRCGRCLVSAAEKDGVKMIAVTLSAPDDWHDHISMLNYGFTQYECLSLAKAFDINIDLPVAGGIADNLKLYNKDELSIVAKKSSADVKCKIEIVGGKLLLAPIAADEHIADAVYYNSNVEVGRIPLYAKESISGVKVKRFFDIFD